MNLSPDLAGYNGICYKITAGFSNNTRLCVKSTVHQEKNMTISNSDFVREKVNLETSQIAWKQLQRFFANGSAVFVAPDLDLVEVAYQFSIDDKIQVEQWLQNQQIALVSDQQALTWFEKEAEVWAVVVKPWILVQE